ncbi:hypothetical protein F5Y18DRAFT_12538 [Xylariaceae sp. FL1019]|nr:hypothetical protein F5Y18DRAFT_12538 [Xylariaceae sp. FL1019]
MSSKKVFIIGPGYIGWNVADNLISEGYSVTGFVRRKEHADQLLASGASDVVLGDLSDKPLITKYAAAHDIVIHTATADDMPSVEAVLDAIQQRIVQGMETIYIHTSGTSVLNDNARGKFKSDKVYSDATPDDIDSVPDDAPHRAIDLKITAIRRDLGPKSKIAIMVPPTIYGINPAHKRLSIQFPTITRYALKHGFAGHIGDGLPVESNVHVLDLARAYVILLHHLEKTPAGDPQVLNNPYYFCEASGENEPSWKEIATVIGDALHDADLIADPNPRSFPEDSYDDLFQEFTVPVVGLNSRSRAVRLRELGWKPVEKDWKRSFVEDELPLLLQEEVDRKAFSGYGGTVAS